MPEELISVSRKIVTKMTCQSVALESKGVEFSGTVPVVAIQKTKNNFSIDHLLAKSDPPVQSISDHYPRELVQDNVHFNGITPYPVDGRSGFASPDSSCGGAFSEDYLDNASEGVSEDSFENGRCGTARWIFK